MGSRPVPPNSTSAPYSFLLIAFRSAGQLRGNLVVVVMDGGKEPIISAVFAELSNWEFRRNTESLQLSRKQTTSILLFFCVF